MNTNRNPHFSSARAAFVCLSAIAMADPTNHHDFLSACERADVLDLITKEHGLVAVAAVELESEFDAYLDDNLAPLLVVGFYEYAHSRVLKGVDMMAYRELFREYADNDFVEHGNRYFRKEELAELSRLEVLDTLTTHCVEPFGLSDEQAEDLSSADTPQQYVVALKRLLLTKGAQVASNKLPQEARRM